MYVFEETLMGKIDFPITVTDCDGGREALENLLERMKDLLGENFHSGVLNLAAMAMSVHPRQ